MDFVANSFRTLTLVAVKARAYPAAGARFPDSRAAARYPLVSAAEVIEPLTKRSTNGSISVISVTGCFFRSTDSVTAGTVVRLRIERDGSTFETWAQVVHVRAEGMGIAFFDTAQNQLNLLRQWIAELAQAATKP